MTNFHSTVKREEWPTLPEVSEDRLIRDGFDPSSLQSCAIAALTSSDLDLKVAITLHAANRWFSRSMAVGVSLGRKAPDRPGRPARPELLPPNLMKKRSIRSQRGRIALVHAIAHIELNAMDLAWDIIARFCHQKLPRSFYDGWVRVALEEAKHFSLLRARLAELDAAYGDFPAHDGLWEAAQNTGHDLVARLAVVPLILEARGLDITPSLIDQLNEIGDTETSYIFSIIYRDELGHVAVGAKWFRYFCFKNQQDPERAFQMLVRRYFRGALKPPFNDFTRCRAGITPMFYRALSAKGN